MNQSNEVLHDPVWADCPDCGVFRVNTEKYPRCRQCQIIYFRIQNEIKHERKHEALVEKYRKQFTQEVAV